MTSPTDRLDHERLAQLIEACFTTEAERRLAVTDATVYAAQAYQVIANYGQQLIALLRGAEAPRADEVRAAAQYAFEMMRNTEMWDDDDYDGHPEMRKHGTLLRDFALGGVTPRAQTTPSAEVLRDALRPLISREAVTDAALLNVADGLRDADFWGSPSPEAPSLPTGSVTVHHVNKLHGGYDAEHWFGSYELLRDAVIEHLARFVYDDDVAEEAIMIAAIEAAGKELAGSVSSPTSTTKAEP